MAKSLALFAALFVGSQASDLWKKEFIHDDYLTMDLKALFTEWKEAHSRGYPTLEEESFRFKVFAANLDHIIEYNSADLSFKLRLNQFADLTSDEFRQKVHGKKGSCLSQKPNLPVIGGDIRSRIQQGVKSLKSKTNVANPDSIDWYV